MSPAQVKPITGLDTMSAILSATMPAHKPHTGHALHLRPFDVIMLDMHAPSDEAGIGMSRWATVDTLSEAEEIRRSFVGMLPDGVRMVIVRQGRDYESR